MQLIIDNDELQEAIRVIMRLAPPVSGAITIESDGTKCFIKSTSDVSYSRINLPAEVSGKANKFNVNLAALKDSTKGRKELTVVYDKTMCNIKSGAFKITLATEDAMEMEHDEEELTSQMKITAEQGSWLKTALSVVALKPTTLLSTFMPVAIRMTNKGVFVCCYDQNHCAYIKSDEITGSMELMLPLDMLTAVLDVFSRGTFKLALTRSSVHISNALVKIVMTRPEEEEGAFTIDELLEGAKASKEKGAQVMADKQQVVAFLDNARAVAAKERSELKITLSKGVMKLQVLTAQGSAESKFKVESDKAADVMIDFEYLDEAVRKSDAQLRMKIIGSDMACFDLKQGTVIVSLNQEDEDQSKDA